MSHGPSQAVFGLGRPATNVPVNQPGVLDETEDNDYAAVVQDTANDGVVDAGALAADSVGASELSLAAGAEAVQLIKTFAATDVNVAHGNPVTVTGIAVGDVVLSVLQMANDAGFVQVATSDAVVGSGAITFTATDFGANDSIYVVFADLT